MMSRWVWPATFVFFAMGVSVSGALFDHTVPRDTLPAHLSLDQIPLGLSERSIPTDNPLTDRGVELGRRLFFDPILSADRTIACSSCHRPDHGFASAGRPVGIRGRQLSRRAPTLLNRAFGKSFFWDGRADSLEHQALLPIVDPDEMGSSLAELLRRLRADKGYKALFEAGFPDGVTAANVGKALASFERVLLRGASRVDRFRTNGEHGGLSVPERHGLWLFESKAHCWRCHGGANFTDESYHNTGVSSGNQPLDPGRYAVTKKDEDRGKFKTPTLRGVALTGPYMHDGTLNTLEDVVGFYNRGGTANPNLDKLLAPLELTDDEMHDLVAFLKAL
jgi:cytochrome c peroxidase